MENNTTHRWRALERGGRRKIWFLAMLGLAMSSAMAGHAEAELEQLKQLSLEELANLEVSIAGKRPQPIADTAAAVIVITDDDIRRSGAVNIAEALRLVPGIHVARINSNTWAISTRGFNDTFSNKQLVLIDGRSVYTPLFSGVYWDIQDVPLEDIERIEVIRGPGASVWGANAVNGVINIITKSAAATQGGLVSIAAGDEEDGVVSLRYGGTVGHRGHYRVYAKAFERDSSVLTSGGAAADDWDAQRLGFRMDVPLSAEEQINLQGEIYDGESGQSLNFSTMPGLVFSDVQDLSGGHLLGRRSRSLGHDRSMSLQLYYDRTERDDIRFEQLQETVDVDFQHEFALTDSQRLVWGLAVRVVDDDVQPGASGVTRLDPAQTTKETYSAFVQDDIGLFDGRVHLTVGTKVEDNEFTGTEIQPSARLLWTIDDRHSLWTAWSRAVRTPSRAETAVQVVVPAVTLSSDPDFDSEKLHSFEIGYRAQPTADLSLDLSAFYNSYDDLGTVDTQPGSGLPISLALGNNLHGNSKGIEAVIAWQPLSRWRLRAAYSYLDVGLDSESPLSVSQIGENTHPDHQLQLGSRMDLGGDWELDASWYYVDELPSPAVDSYLRMDLRVAWHPQDDLELSLVGQNLLEDRHTEFSPSVNAGGGLVNTEVERSFYAKLVWRFR